MKKNIIYLLLISLVVFASCEKNFEEYNLDERSPQVGSEDVLPRYQLGAITEKLKSSGQYTVEVGPVYSQQFCFNTSSYRLSELYAIQKVNMWDNVYKINPTIVNVLEQTAESTDAEEIVVQAITKIAKVYLFSRLTDLHGDIPYSETADKTIQYPKYDTQEYIYNDGFKLLDEAIASLTSQVSAGVKLPEDDRVYGGDAAKWIRFANSLKLRLAMRLRYVDASTSAAKAGEAINHTGGLISNDEQSATLPNFETGTPNHSLFSYREEAGLKMSKFLVDYLKSTNDPRLPIWAAPSVNGGVYEGVENFLVDFPENDDYSSLNADNLFKRDLEDVILMHSESEFLKAEAYVFGTGVTKDATAANTAYRAGIQASLEYWGVAEADVTAFLAQDFATLTGDEEAMLKQIAYQKWVSLFLAGSELWTEARRLKYPEYPDITGNSDYFQGDTQGNMPSRLEYSNNEAAYNAENYDLANKKYPQNIASKVWWDAK
ncbi:MAG: SusD/RagB family nutrient-binding outer membrane lipoprotein [Carboxylicivirga sp.]|jgi:hypothetical protein|nr:SusD/RagB family nutrient-binding outer membrane lipoprotein [Carboxylicivirga sp.]